MYWCSAQVHIKFSITLMVAGSGRTAKNGYAVSRPDRLHTAHHKPTPRNENLLNSRPNKARFPNNPTYSSRKSRHNSFSKGWRKTRSLFQWEALSGLLRYYLDVSAAPGQPQFGEKRTICCEEQDFIEPSDGSGEKTKRFGLVHASRNFLWSKTLQDTPLQFLFLSNSISSNGS